MKCVSDASGIVPQIAIIDGVCGGASAVCASMFDFVVTVKDKSKFYVNSPFVVGDKAGSSDFAQANGTSVYGAQTTDDAFAYARKLLDILPSNNAESVLVENGDDMNRAVAFDAENYKTDELVAQLADNGSFVKMFNDYTDNTVLGIASFG